MSRSNVQGEGFGTSGEQRSPESRSGWGWWDLWVSGSKTPSPVSQRRSGRQRCQQLRLGGETSTSLCFTFGAKTVCGKASGKLTGMLRGRKLQAVLQGLSLSFVNAPFGVFVWTLALGIQGGDETRSPESWGVEAALLSRASDSIVDELEYRLLEMGRKACISGTKSPFQSLIWMFG